MSNRCERARAEGERCLIETFVDLAQHGKARADADRHVAEDEADDEDDAGSGQLDRRHIEGEDVADADHGARNCKAQHCRELEAALPAKRWRASNQAVMRPSAAVSGAAMMETSS